MTLSRRGFFGGLLAAAMTSVASRVVPAALVKPTRAEWDIEWHTAPSVYYLDALALEQKMMAAAINALVEQVDKDIMNKILYGK